MRRDDARHAAGHSLDDGHAKALEQRRVDEDARAAVESRQLVVRRVAESQDAGRVERRLVAPACGAGDDEREIRAAEAAIRLEQRRKVLARFEGRHRQRVRPAELAAEARRARTPHATPSWPDAGIRDVHLLRGDTERLDDVGACEARVDDHHVARLSRMPVLRAVHTARALVNPVGEVQRHEVVHHRRAHTGALRRVHPITEMENVEAPEHALRRRPAGATPDRAQRVRRRDDRQSPVDIDAGERGGDLAASAAAHRRERKQVVLTCGRRREAEHRSADVVADARPLVRQGRDVDDNSHFDGR